MEGIHEREANLDLVCRTVDEMFGWISLQNLLVLARALALRVLGTADFKKTDWKGRDVC